MVGYDSSDDEAAKVEGSPGRRRSDSANGKYADDRDDRRSSKRSRRSRSRTRSRSRSRSKSRSASRSRRHRSRSREGTPSGGFRIHIGDIDGSITERDIRDAVSKFGSTNEIWIATYAPFFAFVNFKHREDGEECLKRMNGQYIGNCRIRVSMALPRRRYPVGGRGPPRYGGGGYGGGGGGFYDRRRYDNYGGGGGYGGSRSYNSSKTYRRSPSYDRRSRS